jgi:DNA-binding response OmpR family regulator
MPAPKKAKKAVKSRRADTAAGAAGADEKPVAAASQSPPEPPRGRRVLESKGYEILVARDGNQGLLMAERENPDLVVLDMMMPKRSGFLVLERLRRSHPVPMRVIMITANEGSRHKAYAEMLGVDDYIRKPFAMDRLLDSVQRLVGAAR